MFSGLFGWLRNSTKAAILGGVQDALTELQLAKPAEEVPTPILVLTHQPGKEDEAPARARKAK